MNGTPRNDLWVVRCDKPRGLGHTFEPSLFLKQKYSSWRTTSCIINFDALLDISRQLQSYSSDELLEGTVCRLQQICRYLLLLSGTNNNLNDVIENINFVLNRLSTCEHRLCSSGYKCTSTREWTQRKAQV